MKLLPACLLAASFVMAAACGQSQDATPSKGPASPPTAAPEPKPARTLRLATTTSVNDTGLLAVLLPVFKEETNISVTVTAVGTGAAFKLAKDGNADLLLVHDKKGEEEFVAGGDGASRTEFMSNTFEIAGPPADPARVKGAGSGAEALKRVATAHAPFVSRGDDSGTHRREKALWSRSGTKPEWPGYVQTGQGMADTLRVADEKEAYILTDQGTRLGYKTPLRIVSLVADTDDLRNVYAVVRISKAKHPEADTETAEVLAAWLTSAKTAERIAAFQVGGNPLFQPIAPPK